MKTLKNLMSILGGILISVSAMAGGGGTIKGNLIDETGGPIIGANVFVVYGGSVMGVQSDMDGKFSIKPIPPGRYTLHITAMGFDSLRIKDIRVIDDRITMFRDKQMNLSMMGEVVITEYVWEHPLIDFVEPGAAVIDDSEIATLPNRNDLNRMISSMVPGVYQPEKGDPLQMRGSRAGASMYFIDGMKAPGFQGGLPSASIGTVRVYTGGIPAQYGDVTGGIVVVETKSYLSWYQKEGR